jgi:adenine-specific DNA methylase
MICLDGGAEYVNQDSYICMVTSGLGVASVLYNLNGSPALANAVNIYNEIRRRQYLGTYNPPLSFANGPKWAIGPIGATQ